MSSGEVGRRYWLRPRSAPASALPRHPSRVAIVAHAAATIARSYEVCGRLDVMRSAPAGHSA